MYRQQIKVLVVFSVLGIGLFSCEFMDLRPIGVSIWPGNPDTILPDEYSPLIISFDTETEKQDAERILQVRSVSGVMEGDLSWKGRRLFFTPVPGWKAGTRYGLSLSGTVKSRDGRELRLDRYVSFYAVNQSPAPVLENFSPPDGASVGAGPGEETPVELRFSRSMDRLSTESAFVMEGMGEKKFEWKDDDRLLAVYPGKALVPWTVYRWTLGAKAASREGVPLAKTVSAQFSTDRDQLFPRVIRVLPMIFSDGRWLPTGGNLEMSLHNLGVVRT
jgi:hypothetical protein